MKHKKELRCIQCSYKTLKWLGKCPQCGNWNTITYEDEVSINEPLNLYDTAPNKDIFLKTNIDSLDTKLGGGLVLGSFVLILGSPGAGKSIFVRQILSCIEGKKPLLYIGNEEGKDIVIGSFNKMRKSRSSIFIHEEEEWSKIETIVSSKKYGYIAIDSLQTIKLYDEQFNTRTSKEIINSISKLSKKYKVTFIVISQSSKYRDSVRLNYLEHIADTCFIVKKEGKLEERSINIYKNRYFRDSANLKVSLKDSIFNFT